MDGPNPSTITNAWIDLLGDHIRDIGYFIDAGAEGEAEWYAAILRDHQSGSRISLHGCDKPSEQKASEFGFLESNTPISTMASSPTENILVTGDESGTLIVWFAAPSLDESPRELFTLSGHRGSLLQCVKFSIDGSVLFSADEDRRMIGRWAPALRPRNHDIQKLGSQTPAVADSCYHLQGQRTPANLSVRKQLTKETVLMLRFMSSLLVVLYLLGSATLLRAAEAPRPNVIFILTDDQGYGDASIHGHPLLRTPNIDRLAKDGVRLDNFYVSPSCSPTRAALLTGMHEFRVGVTHTLQPREHLFADAVTLPSLMQSAGYATGFVGKWHLGNENGYAPCDRGFDWCSTNQQGPRKHFDPTIVRNRKREVIEGYREDIFFDEAMTFIDESRDKPFFCYLATYSPHAPLDAPEEFVAPFREAVDEKHAKYLGMVANLDSNVGRLTDFLDQRGLSDNTVVVFMNDNGQTEGLDVYNAGMRGCKCTIWEGGSRAMAFWKWPGHWQPHTVDNLTAHLDVLPTLCEIAGIGISKTLLPKLEGFSMVPLLESETPIDWNDDRMLFHHVGRWPSGLAASHRHAMCGVRQNNFLLLRSHPCDNPECEQYQSQCTTLRGVRNGLKTTTYTQGNAQFHWGVSAPDRWSLFDPKQDPKCQKDLSAAKPELVAALSSAYEDWWEELYPIMIARGGDAGDPDESRRAASRTKQHVAMMDKEQEQLIGSRDEFAAEREQVAAIGTLTTEPAMRAAEGFDSTEQLKAIYFDALPYRGEPTKAFAWLGMPNNVLENQKVPGIVLVHGGGGTAFKNWVQEWNDRGFAAISVAVEGQTDRRVESKAWERHQWAGPKRVGIYGDSDEPLQDQWMYHAVADTVLANSLLRSLPQVDADRVGLMGISWGGVITSTVVGIDNRFAFAIPTYGCGHLFDAANQYGRSLGENALYRKVWDPMQRLAKAKVPMLWFSWPQDKHFPLDCQSASYHAASGPRMLALVPKMGHGHGPPQRRPESYAFAQAITQTGVPWCRQTDSMSSDDLYHVKFSSDKPLDRAVLVSTTDSGITGAREWIETSAQLQKHDDLWGVTASLPAGTTAWFINVTSGDLIVSSEYQVREAEVQQKTAKRDGNKKRLFARIDRDADAEVTQGEYVAFYTSRFHQLDADENEALSPTEFTNSSAFELGDVNQDGGLTKEEFQSVFEKQFSNLDKDGDGVLPSQEW